MHQWFLNVGGGVSLLEAGECAIGWSQQSSGRQWNERVYWVEWWWRNFGKYTVTLERRKIILPWCGWKSKWSSCPSTPVMYKIKELTIGIRISQAWVTWKTTRWDESSRVEGEYPVIIEHPLGCLMKATGVQGNNKGLQFREESTTLTVPKGGFWGKSLFLACTITMDNTLAPFHGLRSCTDKKGEKVSSQLPDCWLDMTGARVPDCLELLMLQLSRHGGPYPWVKFLKFLLILRTIRKVSRTSVILHTNFHHRVVNWGSTALTIISLAT